MTSAIFRKLKFIYDSEKKLKSGITCLFPLIRGNKFEKVLLINKMEGSLRGMELSKPLALLLLMYIRWKQYSWILQILNSKRNRDQRML